MNTIETPEFFTIYQTISAIMIATLKSAKVIDYEPNYLDDGSISNHKYIIVAQDIQIEKQWSEKYTDFTNK